MEELLIEEHLNLSIASKRPLMSRAKISRSIDSISNVLPPASLLSYPVEKDVHPSAREVYENQFKQVRILENLIGEEGASRTKILNHAHPSLVLEVGDDFIRAFMFDVVEDYYRFIAVGESKTTSGLSRKDIGIGIRKACDQLSETTGLRFLQSDNDGLFSGHSKGEKSHTAAIVLSCNHPLNVVVVNFGAKSSTYDFRKLLKGYPGQIIGEVSIEDDESIFGALDTVVSLKPDLVWVAGLSENEKNNLDEKLKKMSRLVGLSIPEAQQPVFLCGSNNSITYVNQQSSHKEGLNDIGKIFRDSSEVERTDWLKDKLADIALDIHKNNIPGLFKETQPLKHDVIHGFEAFGRIIHFLDLSTEMKNGVLGIDIGSSKTLIAAAQSGGLSMEVFPECGMGSGISNILKNISLAEITEWLSYGVEESYVEQYILNKSLYPSSIPASEVDLDIEFAIAQQILKFTIAEINNDFQDNSKIKSQKVRPSFDRILVTGGILSQVQDFTRTTLALLNGIQPTGATSLFIDTNQIVSILGAAAADNPLLAVQVLDSGIITHLCTLVSANSESDNGTPILRVRMVCQNGDECKFEIKKGDLLKLPLSKGETANLFLQPFHRCDVGMGAPGRGGVIRVSGGHVGVIVDARGRPLTLRGDKHHRIDQIRGWYRVLDGDFT